MEDDINILLLNDKSFCAGQYLPIEFGKCHNYHGHNYRMTNIKVKTKGIVDLSRIKEVIDSFDHVTIAPEKDAEQLQKIVDFMVKESINIFVLKYITIPYDMSAGEYIGKYIKDQMMKICGVLEVTFELYETATQGFKIP